MSTNQQPEEAPDTKAEEAVQPPARKTVESIQAEKAAVPAGINAVGRKVLDISNDGFDLGTMLSKLKSTPDPNKAAAIHVNMNLLLIAKLRLKRLKKAISKLEVILNKEGLL